MRRLAYTILTVLFSTMLAGQAKAEGRIMITSYTNDFQFASGNVGCPKGEWGNAFIVDLDRLGDRMNIRDYEEVFNLIGRYEYKHGIQIRSKTRVRDFEVIEDRIRTEATGPVDDVGTALCSLIAGYLKK